MLKRKKQRKYLAKKGKEWQDQLRVFGNSHQDEALHQLRVAVKKIRAFARLSEACSGKAAAAKDFRLLKKMFRQAGMIRDVGNRLHQLEHFHTAPGPIQLEQLTLKEAETRVFIDHIPQYRKKGKKAGRLLLQDVHSIPTDRIRKWYGEQLIHISVLLTASGDRLHKARKKIKELLYVLKHLSSRLQDGLALDAEYLDSVQDAIGKWHDVAVLVTSWAGKDLDSSQAMVKECREKEAAVRRLAGDFYLKAHHG